MHVSARKGGVLMNDFAMISRRGWLGAVALASLASTVRAEEPTDDAARAAQLTRMKEMAQRFRVSGQRNGQPVSGTLSEKPLLRYSDVARNSGDSTLWIWKERELPCGVMAIEFYPKYPLGKQSLFEFASLSDTKLTVTRGDDWKWTAREPGLQRRPIAKAPEPAEKAPGRLAQAKQLFQRFAAHEQHGIVGRLELRALTNPLYRYQDEQTGVVDGAIFTFVSGTNPEIAIVIEALRDDSTKSVTWHYSLAQMTGAEIHASLDEQEVWVAGDAEPPSDRKSYVNGWFQDPAIVEQASQ